MKLAVIEPYLHLRNPNTVKRFLAKLGKLCQTEVWNLVKWLVLIIVYSIPKIQTGFSQTSVCLYGKWPFSKKKFIFWKTTNFSHNNLVSQRSFNGKTSVFACCGDDVAFYTVSSINVPYV